MNSRALARAYQTKKCVTYAGSWTPATAKLGHAPPNSQLDFQHKANARGPGHWPSHVWQQTKRAIGGKRRCGLRRPQWRALGSWISARISMNVAALCERGARGNLKGKGSTSCQSKPTCSSALEWEQFEDCICRSRLPSRQSWCAVLGAQFSTWQSTSGRPLHHLGNGAAQN